MVIEEDELAFHGKDPGAVKFGNFINYYSFHDTDQRVESLHMSMFPGPFGNNDNDIVCLDIGCNTGELTAQLFDYLNNIVYPTSNVYILGIDIDPILIQRASDHIKNDNISFVKMNVMDIQDQENVCTYLNTHNRKKFDIVFCFSVTMWIHINNGDDRFLDFLHYLKEISRAIIIEPQPWKCYRNAQRRMKKSGSNFPLYESLQLRNSIETVIEKTLSQNDFTKVYQSSPSKWNRIIQCFHLT